MVIEARSGAKARMFAMSPSGHFATSSPVSAPMGAPINVASDVHRGRLLWIETVSGELVATRATAGDRAAPPSSKEVVRYRAGPLDLQDPQGLVVDPDTGHVYILDSGALQIVCVEPDAEGNLGSASALAEGRVSRINLERYGVRDARGLALNPSNGHLYLIGAASERLHEFARADQPADDRAGDCESAGVVGWQCAGGDRERDGRAGGGGVRRGRSRSTAASRGIHDAIGLSVTRDRAEWRPSAVLSVPRIKRRNMQDSVAELMVRGANPT
jgi:hypothetical protein